MQKEQYVCMVCGYNMVGYHPARCPFCGASRSKFIPSEECSARFKVQGTPVSEKVTRLNSVPSLGYEHAAYRIETDGTAFWIDCPSCFDRSLRPVEAITFTHHHFLGASNQYRDLFAARVRIHQLDSQDGLGRGFTFDETFVGNHKVKGIEAFPVDGHTPGFTFYIFEDILFICDYVLKGEGMVFNPFGPERETRRGGENILMILEGQDISRVCGSHYVADYSEWKEKFDKLLQKD